MVIRLIGTLSLTGLMGSNLLAAIDDPLLPGWGQLGVAGLALVAFYTDRVVTGNKYAQAIKERDDERARTEKAENKLEEKFLPALLDTQLALRTVNDQILPLLSDVREALNEWKAGHNGNGNS